MTSQKRLRRRLKVLLRLTFFLTNFLAKNKVLKVAGTMFYVTITTKLVSGKKMR